MRQYAHILALRHESDNPKRGYQFEQCLREILPWSFRPPIAVTGSSEQLDAFFEWNGWHFLMESKAKTARILAGSHDWEDFELKMQRRKGHCIGLFCSLNDVDVKVYNQAEHLNRASCPTVVIAGPTWDDLNHNKFPIEDFIRYMVLHAKAKYIAQPPSIETIRKWCYDRKTVSENIGKICQSASSTFLRRHRLSRHREVYLPRQIDAEIHELAKLLRPSNLEVSERTAARGSVKFQRQRVRPKQLALVKDLSGSGKTTLSVQLSLERDGFYGMARAALEPDVDKLLELLSEIGRDYGMGALAIVDRSMVYVIDSLDEATTLPQKRKEIRGVFKALEELNKRALEHGMMGFPILIVFTIRDDFWREWEAQFEGQNMRSFVRRFSYFSPTEALEAVTRYSRAYEYIIDGPVDSSLINILSHPFSLQVFSEANEYVGKVLTGEALGRGVMSLYFERKKEDVLKRPIPGFQGDAMLRLCSEVAVAVANRGSNEISSTEVIQLIQGKEPTFGGFAADIANSLVSEQILVRDAQNPMILRFRHMRFIEYLLAYHVALRMDLERRPQILDEVTTTFLSSGFVSIYYIHDFIRHICMSKFPETYEAMTSFYAKSFDYMKKLLSLRRIDIARGERTSNLDLDAIRLSMAARNAEVCWDGFFVLAAKRNGESDVGIIQAFELAWDTHVRRIDRWRALTKLAGHKLLLHESVLSRIAASQDPKEWQVFLEQIDQSVQLSDFPEVWREYGGSTIEASLTKRKGSEWEAVKKLLGHANMGRRYPRGEIIC